MQRATLPYLIISLCALLIAGLSITANAGAQAADVVAAAAGQPQRAAERVGVHGYWTIDVADPDGRPVTHTEFENALDPQGAATLIALLSRTNSLGRWRIELGPSGTSQSPCVSTGDVTANGSSCVLAESPAPPNTAGSIPTITDGTSNTLQFGEAGPTTPTGLSVITGTGADAGKLVLAGTLTATQTGSIGQARTSVARCAPTLAPSTPCAIDLRSLANANLPFTVATLPQPVTVSAGQVLQVNVALTFTCASAATGGCGEAPGDNS